MATAPTGAADRGRAVLIEAVARRGTAGRGTGRSHRLQPSEIPGGTALITRRPAEQQHPVDAPGDRAFRRGRSLIPYYAGAGPYASYGDYAPYWDFLVYRSADD